MFYSSAKSIGLYVFIAVSVMLCAPPGRAQSHDLDTLNAQVEQPYQQGKYTEAIPVAQRALAGAEKKFGRDHPQVATSLNNLAALYREQGRYTDAEPLYQQALAITEKALGLDHPDVAATLEGLAGLYEAQRRYDDAEPLFQRALTIIERALGLNHPDVANALNSLAGLYLSQNRIDDAKPLFQRAVSITEKALGHDHPEVASTLGNLASLYEQHGAYDDAEPLFRRALAITEKALGLDHPEVGTLLNNLALMYLGKGDYDNAEPLFQRALANSEKALGPDHPDVAATLNNLAKLYSEKRDWVRSVDFLRRCARVIVHRTQRGTNNLGKAVTGKNMSEATHVNWIFTGLVKISHRLNIKDQSVNTAPLREARMREMFLTAQRGQRSEAAASLAQMAARAGTSDPALARLVRKRQDLVAEWQKRDGVRTAAVSQLPDKRDAQAEATNVVRLAEIDTRVAAIDTRLLSDFPNYADYSRPQPLAVDDVKAVLRDNEALILFLETTAHEPIPEETFIWVVTKSDAKWVRSELGTHGLRDEVDALRCGLDSSNWVDASQWPESTDNQKRVKREQIAQRERCKTLTGRDILDTAPLPFDSTRAHKLYRALFGEVEALIKGKHLLIAPSGPLTQLPFQVLVTEAPKNNDHKTAAWLARDHTTTVLPAVSSLKALRRVSKPSIAPKPMIGFGNPLLDGDQAHPTYGAYYKQSAALAADKKFCPKSETRRQRVAAFLSQRGGVTPIALRGGLVDVAHLHQQAPLPETADELCAVAHDLKSDSNDIFLGARASERDIKAMNARGVLANYQIVHFATHGTLAGQLSGTTEPGLILTPPDKATREDDGYLSASEIAGLKLDADWVILSACNTAAGGADGTEALSGLASAFFYAKARSLLVSHWAVYSDATVKLITSAVRAMARDKGVGRAEALRRAMLALIDTGKPHEAHPSYWAPFIVVGEGAAGN